MRVMLTDLIWWGRLFWNEEWGNLFHLGFNQGNEGSQGAETLRDLLEDSVHSVNQADPNAGQEQQTESKVSVYSINKG